MQHTQKHILKIEQGLLLLFITLLLLLFLFANHQSTIISIRGLKNQYLFNRRLRRLTTQLYDS